MFQKQNALKFDARIFQSRHIGIGKYSVSKAQGITLWLPEGIIPLFITYIECSACKNYLLLTCGEFASYIKCLSLIHI